MFTVNLVVENATALTENQVLELVMPFDVFYKENESKTYFVSKGNKITIFKPNAVITNDTLTFGVEFRLPSWVVEAKYDGSSCWKTI